MKVCDVYRVPLATNVAAAGLCLRVAGMSAFAEPLVADLAIDLIRVLRAVAAAPSPARAVECAELRLGPLLEVDDVRVCMGRPRLRSAVPAGTATLALPLRNGPALGWLVVARHGRGFLADEVPRLREAAAYLALALPRAAGSRVGGGGRPGIGSFRRGPGSFTTSSPHHHRVDTPAPAGRRYPR